MQGAPTVLLADADALIDYRESELAILDLVAQHLGRLAVLSSVLDEVRGVTPTQCAQLGIEIIEVETERMLRATEVESSTSFSAFRASDCRAGVLDLLRDAYRTAVPANGEGSP